MFNKKTDEEKEKKFMGTYTKRWVTIIMVVALIDMQLSYLLAFIGKTDIAESLSVAIATEVIGVMIGYFVKAFLETYAEEKNKMVRLLEGIDEEDYSYDDTEDEEESENEDDEVSSDGSVG